jgi:hypothetical protein
MKSSSKILLAVTAAAALSVAYPAKANLISNLGFETGDFTGWSVSGPASVEGTVGSIAPHSGNFQAQLGSFGSIGQTLATTPGQFYTIDFWVASPGISSVFVVWGGFNVFGHIFAGPTGYTELKVPRLTASSTSTSFLITQETVPGISFLDDVSVNPTVPDGGSTVSLLGCALLGLAGLWRKLPC